MFIFQHKILALKELRVCETPPRYTAERIQLRKELSQLQKSLELNKSQLEDQRRQLTKEKAAVEARIKDEMAKKLAEKDAKYEENLRRQRDELQEHLTETVEEQETLKVGLCGSWS